MTGASHALPLRSLFISDLHLGARGCRVDAVLAFLKANHAERIFLVGDILDIWHGSVHWDARHDAVISTLLERARQGVEITYIYGNHDREIARREDRILPEFTLCERLSYETVDGTRLLVLHGDQGDSRLLRFHFMTRLGSRLDALMRRVDVWLKRQLGRSEYERSVIQAAINGVNAVLSHGNLCASRLMRIAREGGYDGIVCGHFHKPALREMDAMVDANCGDWMDSFQPRLSILKVRLQVVSRILWKFSGGALWACDGSLFQAAGSRA